MRTKKQKTRAGFTLIELLVAIAIVGVLSGVVLQSLNSARAKSRNAQRLTEIDQLNKAFELSATGGTNALPTTTISPTNYYICLGLTADTSPTCGGLATTGGTVAQNNLATAINTIVSNNLANKVIPRDSSFLTNIGTAYLYRSNLTPPAGITTDPGAYLSWVVESTVTPSCGRGQMATDSVTNGRQCFLRIGNAI